MNGIATANGRAPGDGGYGNHVKIMTDDRHEYLIGHFAPGSLKGLGVGDRVERGQYLGEMGTTGNSTGIHAHVELTNKTAQQENVIGWLKSIGAIPGDIPDYSDGTGAKGGPDGGHPEGEGGEGEVAFAPLDITLRVGPATTSALRINTINDPYSGAYQSPKKVVR